jgi:hypothetical protein
MGKKLMLGTAVFIGTICLMFSVAFAAIYQITKDEALSFVVTSATLFLSFVAAVMLSIFLTRKGIVK